MGIFWHLITSLRRVLIGFTIATLIAVPVGFLLGRSTALRWAVDPIMQILRPVSPLAWLPLGLALLSSAERTAIFVIVLSALWPTLVSTIDAVRGVNSTYINLAATLGTPVVADYLCVVAGSIARNYHGVAVVIVDIVVGDYCRRDAGWGSGDWVFCVESVESSGY